MVGIIIGSLLVLIAGLLALWWARASRRGTLPQNWVFGYRTPLTLKDKNAWIAVNSASGPFAMIAGIGAIVAGLAGIVLALFGMGSTTPTFLGSGLGWLVVWTLLGIIPAHRAARNYKRTLDAR